MNTPLETTAAHPAERRLVSYTPGPWKILRAFPRRLPFGIAQDRQDAMDCTPVLTSHAFAKKTTDTAEANARLIAAAPDLLAACKEAERLIRNGGTVPVQGMTWEKLTRAIARAEWLVP